MQPVTYETKNIIVSARALTHDTKTEPNPLVPFLMLTDAWPFISRPSA